MRWYGCSLLGCKWHDNRRAGGCAWQWPAEDTDPRALELPKDTAPDCPGIADVERRIAALDPRPPEPMLGSEPWAGPANAQSHFQDDRSCPLCSGRKGGDLMACESCRQKLLDKASRAGIKSFTPGSIMATVAADPNLRADAGVAPPPTEDRPCQRCGKTIPGLLYVEGYEGLCPACAVWAKEHQPAPHEHIVWACSKCGAPNPNPRMEIPQPGGGFRVLCRKCRAAEMPVEKTPAASNPLLAIAEALGAAKRTPLRAVARASAARLYQREIHRLRRALRIVRGIIGPSAPDPTLDGAAEGMAEEIRAALEHIDRALGEGGK